MKIDYYVPIIKTPLTFGMQISLPGMKQDYKGVLDYPKIMEAKPQVHKYYFEFCIPDEVFYATNDAPPYNYTYNTNINNFQPPMAMYPHHIPMQSIELNNPLPTPNRLTYKFKDAKEFKPKLYDPTKIIVSKVENMIVNNNIQYEFPTYYNIPSMPIVPYVDPKMEAIERLKTLIRTDSPTLETDETLLLTFLSQTIPKLKGDNISELPLSSIWEHYNEGSIELFKLEKNGMPKMVVYAASLMELHISVNKIPIVNFSEVKPHHLRIPLCNKVLEITNNFDQLSLIRIGEVDEDSWFSVGWSHINATPQLHVTGNFTIYYTFSKVGCKQIGMISQGIDTCEFWKCILNNREAARIIFVQERAIKENNIIKIT